MGPISTNREAIVNQMTRTLARPTFTANRLAAMTTRELRLWCNRLSAEWGSKSYPDEAAMGARWLMDVQAARDELHRRGSQLSLFG